MIHLQIPWTGVMMTAWGHGSWSPIVGLGTKHHFLLFCPCFILHKLFYISMFIFSALCALTGDWILRTVARGKKDWGQNIQDNCLILERVKTFPYFYLYCILFVINLHVHNIEIISCFVTCNGRALVFLTLSNCPDNGFVNPGRRPD